MPVSRRGLFLLLSLAIATGAVALARLPATWLDAALSEASHHKLRLARAEGTLWSGQGLLITGGARQTLITPLSWRLESEFRDGAWLALRLKTGTVHPGQDSWIGVGPTGLKAERVHLQTDAAALADWVRSDLAALGLRGRLELELPAWRCSWQALRTGPGDCSGHAGLAWYGAGLERLSGIGGDYRLDVDAEAQGALALRLASAGDFNLKAQGEWRPSHGIALRGSIQGSPQQIDALTKFPLLTQALHPNNGGATFELNIPN